MNICYSWEECLPGFRSAVCSVSSNYRVYIYLSTVVLTLGEGYGHTYPWGCDESHGSSLHIYTPHFTYSLRDFWDITPAPGLRIPILWTKFPSHKFPFSHALLQCFISILTSFFNKYIYSCFGVHFAIVAHLAPIHNLVWVSTPKFSFIVLLKLTYLAKLIWGEQKVGGRA